MNTENQNGSINESHNEAIEETQSAVIQENQSEETIPVVPITWEEAKQRIEALIFASDEVLSTKAIISSIEGMELKKDDVQRAVHEINQSYEETGRSFKIEDIADGYRFLTKKEFAPIIQKMLNTKIQRKLSQAALETLAIIAYKQPISRPEIEAIRGTSVDYVIRTLLQKEFVEVVGRSEEAGKAILYGTTREFLDYFKLKTLADLPKLREIEEIMKETDADALLKESRAKAEQTLEIEFDEVTDENNTTE